MTSTKPRAKAKILWTYDKDSTERTWRNRRKRTQTYAIVRCYDAVDPSTKARTEVRFGDLAALVNAEGAIDAFTHWAATPEAEQRAHRTAAPIFVVLPVEEFSGGHAQWLAKRDRQNGRIRQTDTLRDHYGDCVRWTYEG